MEMWPLVVEVELAGTELAAAAGADTAELVEGRGAKATTTIQAHLVGQA